MSAESICLLLFSFSLFLNVTSCLFQLVVRMTNLSPLLILVILSVTICLFSSPINCPCKYFSPPCFLLAVCVAICLFLCSYWLWLWIPVCLLAGVARVAVSLFLFLPVSYWLCAWQSVSTSAPIGCDCGYQSVYMQVWRGWRSVCSSS